jgi:putative sigma-54 modulation protein
MFLYFGGTTMDVNIQGLNMKLNPGVEAYAKKKLDRLDRYLPGITDVHLDLTHENSKRGGILTIAQLTIRHQRGAILRTEERTNGDMEAAINLAIDKMYRQIERFKGKRKDGKRRTAGRYEALPEELDAAEAVPGSEVDATSPYADYSAIEDAQEAADGIVRRKEVEVIAMTEEEAVQQMELLAHDFFMFFNADTGIINVVYKRKTGGYGVLVPNVE